MNKLLTIAILFAYTGIFAQRTTLPNTATQSPSNKNLNNLNGQVIQDRLVVNDSAWFNGVQNVFPNGNVGIGTTTPEAKLHVSSNDTPSVAIAHFENNLGTAIMTLHSHADSSVIYYMQTGAYSGFIGLEGLSKTMKISNGLGSVAIEIDTNNNVTIPDLAGSAQKIVTAGATGILDTASFSDLRPYNVYTALLTQTSTNAPVATVLENTLGDVTFGYSAPGIYTINSAALFTLNKTAVFVGIVAINGSNSIFGIASGTITTSIMYLEVIAGDDFLSNTPIEIRVYP